MGEAARRCCIGALTAPGLRLELAGPSVLSRLLSQPSIVLHANMLDHYYPRALCVRRSYMHNIRLPCGLSHYYFRFWCLSAAAQLGHYYPISRLQHGSIAATVRHIDSYLREHIETAAAVSSIIDLTQNPQLFYKEYRSCANRAKTTQVTRPIIACISDKSNQPQRAICEKPTPYLPRLSS